MQEMCTIVNEEKGPEEKEYLVCLSSSYEDHWSICIGRKEAYMYIKESLYADQCIDVEESFVLTETHRLNDRRSLYKFIKYCQELYNDGFEIDDYIITDTDDTYKNNVDNELSIDIDSRLSMQSIMNGEASVEEE